MNNNYYYYNEYYMLKETICYSLFTSFKYYLHTMIFSSFRKINNIQSAHY